MDFFHIFFQTFFTFGASGGNHEKDMDWKYLDLIEPLVEPKGAETDIPSQDLDPKLIRYWGFEVEEVLLGVFFLYAGRNIRRSL